MDLHCDLSYLGASSTAVRRESLSQGGSDRCLTWDWSPHRSQLLCSVWLGLLSGPDDVLCSKAG